MLGESGGLMQVVGLSDIGLVRKRNEDNLLIREKEGIFVICDGMGGHKGGNVASSLAIQTVETEIDNIKSLTVPLLNEAIIKANKVIYQKGLKNPDLHEMGTTLSAVFINNLDMNICHVGDSRVYLIRANEIKQITTDHTLAEEMVHSGMKDSDEQKSYSHILTRALGISENVEIDNIALQLKLYDTILLCSDGLSDMLTEQELLSFIIQDNDIKVIADSLLQEALKKGGADNISLILVRINRR